MLTIIYIYFNFTINVTYRPFKLRHVDDMDWVLLKCLGWVISLQVKGWTGLNKWKGKWTKTKTVDCTADSKRTIYVMRPGNVRLIGAGCEQPIQPAPRSVPAPRPPAPRSAPLHRSSATPAHRSAPLHPIFGLLRSVFRSAHAPLTCSEQESCSISSAVRYYSNSKKLIANDSVATLHCSVVPAQRLWRHYLLRAYDVIKNANISK